jgi:hypothetical protein
VKLQEFNDLCREEWKNGHGEVINLWLTEESYRELSNEAMTAGFQKQMALHVREDYADVSRVRGDPAISAVINPVTKAPVRMKLARDRDAADVYNSDTRQMYIKVL